MTLGRPRIADQEKKDALVSVPMQQARKQEFAKLAAAYGLSAAELGRRCFEAKLQEAGK